MMSSLSASRSAGLRHVNEVWTLSEDVSAAQVGQTLFSVYHQVHRVVDQAMTAAGVSLARAKVLVRLHDHGPMNQAKLAGLLGFAPRSVTDAVDALERAGLVTRTSDERDRRARIVALTDAAQVAHDTALTVRAKTLDELFGALAPDERTALAALLTKIRTNVVPGDVHCEYQ